MIKIFGFPGEACSPWAGSAAPTSAFPGNISEVTEAELPAHCDSAAFTAPGAAARCHQSSGGTVMPPLMAAAAVTAAPYRALGTKTQLQSKIAAGQAPCQSCEGDESSRSREMELRM